jgi:hypothetical protein
MLACSRRAAGSLSAPQRARFRAMADAAVVSPGVVTGERAPAPMERPDFQIVPRAGLPIVAVVLALLIAGVAVNELWPLEFLHVVAGDQ